MPGRNRQYDIEIAKIPESPGQVDLVPLSSDGVQALSGYLGREVELGVSVRMTDDQYTDFTKYTRKYAEEHGRGFSTTTRRRFKGQRQLDPEDFDTLRADVEVPSELSSRLSSGGDFLVLKAHNFSVLPQRYGPPANGQLYKVTQRKYTPRRSLSVSIGTLDHYRNTVDQDEAAFTVEEPSKGTISVEGKGSAEALLVGGEMNPCWIYCTTLATGSFDQSEWRGREATPIVCSVDHFAYMLGAAFGVWSKPRVREVYAALEPVEVLRGTMNGIMILHGPVRYMDRGERNEHLRSLARQRSPLELPENVFTKSDEFAWESEYRFGIFGWGPPLQDHVILPVNGELLDCYGYPVPIPP